MTDQEAARREFSDLFERCAGVDSGRAAKMLQLGVAVIMESYVPEGMRGFGVSMVDGNAVVAYCEAFRSWMEEG